MSEDFRSELNKKLGAGPPGLRQRQPASPPIPPAVAPRPQRRVSFAAPDLDEDEGPIANKNILFAYLCYFTGGLFGLHHFYLHRSNRSFLWSVSLGYFGIGFLVDFLNIPRYVKEVNRDKRTLEELQTKASYGDKPVSLKLAVFQIFVMMYFRSLALAAFPTRHDEIVPFQEWAKYAVCAFVVALAAWLVGCEGYSSGSFSLTLFGAVIGEAWIVFGPSLVPSLSEGTVQLLSFVLVVLFFRQSSRYDLDAFSSKRRTGAFKRGFLIFTSFCLFSSLFASSMYYNGTIKSEDGTEHRIKDSIQNLLNSPQWRQFKQIVKELLYILITEGWDSFARRLNGSLDVSGRQRAFESLDLPAAATTEEIRAKYKELVKIYHPDKCKTEYSAEECEKKFREIQEAYDLLTNNKPPKKQQ